MSERLHEWMKMRSFSFEACRLCGVIKRRNGPNKPCKGPVKVALRECTAPAQDQG